MTKSEALKNDLSQALVRFVETLAMPETDVNRDACIQRFEFTFELSWKLMAEISKDNSKIEFSGIKNTIRTAANIGLIEEASSWFPYLEARNLTSHTYNQDTAKEVYNSIKTFPNLVNSFLNKTTDFL